MAKVKSAKDILISNDFLEAREKAGKYISHEFQDYAYRLANDLGDLQHKAIYMKLARTVDRTLLEQAAAFALGYFDEPNKGKLFMWKVQQLRKLTQQKLDMQNTRHDFVMQKMGEIMDDLVDVFSAAQKRDDNDQNRELLNMFAQRLTKQFDQHPDKLRILVLGCGAGQEAKYLQTLGFRVHGLDVSRKLVKKAKKLCERNMVRKPDPLENSFKNDYFHGVIVTKRFWQHVPFESESKYLDMISRLTKQEGLCLIQFQPADENAEGWEKFTWNDEEHIRFIKKGKLPKLQKFDWEMIAVDAGQIQIEKENAR